MSGSKPKSAATYVRISDDPTHAGAGVERQREDCEARASALGWTIGQVYTDNDVSAYRRGTVRPGWQAMLVDLASGARDGVVAYDLDRVARQPRDLEDLLDLVDTRGLRTAVVTGDIDLSNSNGVFLARLLVSVANKSSADTARRVSRQRLQAAREGRPRANAQRAYGYDRRVLVVEHEAVIVCEIFDRAIAGWGFQAIASDLNQRGIPSSTGKAWVSSSIRSILINPMRAGLSSVKGEIVGKGQWEPIITVKTFNAAQSALASRAKTPGHNVRRHLLTGFLLCGRCGAKLVANHDAYVCRAASGGCGRISRQRRTVDAAVTRALMLRFEGLNLVADEESPDLTLEIERALAKIAAIQNAFDADLLTVQDYVASVRAARSALEALTSAQSQQTRARARKAALLDPAASWEVSNLTRRRLMIDAAIEVVVIGPAGRGHRGEAALKSIDVVWRS